MYFKSCIFKTQYFTFVPLFANFRNISMYSSFVMHLPEDGHTIAETCRMYASFIMYFHTHTCVCWFQLSYFGAFVGTSIGHMNLPYLRFSTTKHNSSSNLSTRQPNSQHSLSIFFIVAIFSTQCRNTYTSTLQYYIVCLFLA